MVLLLVMLCKEVEVLSQGCYKIVFEFIVEVDLFGLFKDLYSVLFNLVSNVVCYILVGGVIMICW